MYLPYQYVHQVLEQLARKNVRLITKSHKKASLVKIHYHRLKKVSRILNSSFWPHWKILPHQFPNNKQVNIYLLHFHIKVIQLFGHVWIDANDERQGRATEINEATGQDWDKGVLPLKRVEQG